MSASTIETAGGAGRRRADVDEDLMTVALGLARRGLGNVWPNPAVGCVIARDGRIVGRGWTCPGGRPHAEAEALARAGAEARGATAYVTLEPCAHHGRTPPCADALIEAGIARVVFACEDPDPRVSGRGARRLREAGVEVCHGGARRAAESLNAGFIRRVTAHRPSVTLKVATSLDGRIATASGDSKWITGATARAFAHGMRLRHDAILVGIGTVLADDPDLTCRLPGGAPRPAPRVVFDTNGRLPAASRLARSAGETPGKAPVWLIAAQDAGFPADLPDGVEVIRVSRGAQGRVNPTAALAALAERGITRILLEGGGQVAGALLRSGLVDALAWFRAGIALGAEGRPALGDLALDAIERADRFRCIRRWLIDGDLLEFWERPETGLESPGRGG